MRKVLLLTLLPVAACARDPGDARLRPDAQPSVRVAEAALAANAPEVALNVARNLLKADPYNVPAQLAQGAALYAVGDLAQAATSYRTVLTVQPRSAEAQLGLGRVFLARDQAREAEAAFRASLALEARAPAWSNLGIALDMQTRHGEAQAAYREALKLDPRNEGARSNLEVSLAMASGGAVAPQALHPAAGMPMRLSAADPTAQPFAPEQPTARRRREAIPGRDVGEADRGRGVRETAAPYAAPAPAFAAPEPSGTVQLVAMPGGIPPAAAPELAASAPVTLVAATNLPAGPVAAAAPDPMAQTVQVALSPGGRGLLADAEASDGLPRPQRRAAPRLSAAPAPAQLAVFQPPMERLPVAALAPAPVVLPVAPAVAPTPVRAAPAAPARAPAPLVLASAPAPIPTPAPAALPAPRRLAATDRFDPAAVPMPVVPLGATAAPMTPLPLERTAAPEEGRWLRASR